MLTVAALYSVTSVIGKHLLTYAPPLFFGPFYSCLLAIIVLLFFSVNQPRTMSILWHAPKGTLLVATAAALEAVTHYLAIQNVEVAYMLAVKRSSLLVGILYGAWLFKEQRLMQHLVAGTLMVAGVILVAI